MAYRTVFSVRGVRGYLDTVILQHSRAHAWLAFNRVGAPVPRSERLRLARLVAARMKIAMRDDANLLP